MTGRRIRWAGLAALMATATPALGQTPSGAAPDDIRHVIEAQMEAFQRDDGPTALSYATPALRQKFGDGQRFLAMVRAAYPSVYRPKRFTFGPLAPDGHDFAQHVEIVGPGGEADVAVYDMHREADGSWRIAGCVLARNGQEL